MKHLKINIDAERAVLQDAIAFYKSNWSGLLAIGIFVGALLVEYKFVICSN